MITKKLSQDSLLKHGFWYFNEMEPLKMSFWKGGKTLVRGRRRVFKRWTVESCDIVTGIDCVVNFTVKLMLFSSILLPVTSTKSFSIGSVAQTSSCCAYFKAGSGAKQFSSFQQFFCFFAVSVQREKLQFCTNFGYQLWVVFSGWDIFVSLRSTPICNLERLYKVSLMKKIGPSL